jgi:hypothetical protein
LDGFYLIGLSSCAPTHTPTSDQERQRMASALAATLLTFESDVRSNARYYDPAAAFVSVAEIASSHVPPALVLDAHRWPDGGFDGDEDGDEEEEEGGDLAAGHEEEDADARAFFALVSAASLRRKKRAKEEAKRTPHVPPGLKQKLRSSSDVYNRLIWDPAVSEDDYVIGYEDRFLGTREMPLGAWSREVEDETFVRGVFFWLCLG